MSECSEKWIAENYDDNFIFQHDGAQAYCLQQTVE